MAAVLQSRLEIQMGLRPNLLKHTFHCNVPFGARSYNQQRGLPSLVRATPALDSVTSSVWDQKYGNEYGELKYATSLLQGKRDDMQDFVDVNPKARCGFLYAGVFDGHGGVSAADYLSQKLYTVFSEKVSEDALANGPSVEDEELSGLYTPLHLKELLTDSFLQMDKDLLKWLAENQEGDEALAGSTATVLLVRNDKIVVANVGDSRAVLSRKGEPYDLSAEHRVAGTGDVVDAEIKRVESVGGWIADERVCDVLAVSRAFGDPNFKGEGLPKLLEYGIECEFWDQKFANTIKFTGDPVVAIPDVTEIAVGPDDEFVLLATDGLWDVMSSKDAVAMARSDLQKGRSPQSVADKLANIALRRFSEDNIAVVVVDLGGGQKGWGHKKSAWKFFGG